MNEKQQLNADAWIEVFTQLRTSGVPPLNHLQQITAPNIRFRDPFNDLTGQSAIHKLLQHTLAKIPEVQFEVLDKVYSAQRVYLKWRMTGNVRLLGAWEVEGMSELIFDGDGLLLAHLDFWDASEQFYGHLPIIGWLLRRIRGLASVS